MLLLLQLNHLFFFVQSNFTISKRDPFGIVNIFKWKSLFFLLSRARFLIFNLGFIQKKEKKVLVDQWVKPNYCVSAAIYSSEKYLTNFLDTSMYYKKFTFALELNFRKGSGRHKTINL